MQEYRVRQQKRGGQWVVKCGGLFYGSYLDKNQAVLDAVDAARDSQQIGHEAQVWVQERGVSARVY